MSSYLYHAPIHLSLLTNSTGTQLKLKNLIRFFEILRDTRYGDLAQHEQNTIEQNAAKERKKLRV